MARKKQPKRRWLRALVLLITVPLIVWAGAFLLWLHWHDLNRWLGSEDAAQHTPHTPPLIRKEEARSRGVPERPQEKITDEDRRNLEDILKRRK